MPRLRDTVKARSWGRARTLTKPFPGRLAFDMAQKMNDDTLVIRMPTQEAEKHEEALDRLEELIEERGIGECAASMDLAGIDRAMFVELEPGSTLTERTAELVALIQEVGLSGIAEVSQPELVLGEDDDLDDEDEDPDLDDEDLDDDDLETEPLDDDDKDEDDEAG
jgi:hypothetical protein